MARLNESDFYYGAVLSNLLNSKISPMIVEAGRDRQVYDFTTDEQDFRLFVKYRSEPIKTKAEDYFSWQFNLTQKDIDELRTYLRLNKITSLGLICGNTLSGKSKYAVLHTKEISRLIEDSKTSLTISIKKGEKAFRMSVGGGRGKAIKIKANQLF